MSNKVGYQYYVNCRHTNEMKTWSWKLWLRFKQLQIKAKNFLGASTGFEPVASALALQCSTNCAMKTHTLGAGQFTVESRFPEPSVSRTSWYLEPNFVSLGFTSPELYNFSPDFSNPQFLETPDNSNQFFFPWDKLTLDNSEPAKISKHLSADVNYIHAFKQINTLW